MNSIRFCHRDVDWNIESDPVLHICDDVQEAEAMLKPGVHWDDLHFACHRILCEEFLRLGIFHGASVEEILLKQLTVAFYPHGLGKSWFGIRAKNRLLRRDGLIPYCTSTSRLFRSFSGT